MKKFSKRRYAKKRSVSRAYGYRHSRGFTIGKNSTSLVRKAPKPFWAHDRNAMLLSGRLNTAGCLPSKMFTTLRYSEQITVYNQDISFLVGGETLFQLNDIHLPSNSGTSHQPLLKDQVVNLYATYKVYRVDIQVRMLNASNTHAALILRLTNSGTYTFWVPTSKYVYEAQEQQNCVVLDGRAAMNSDCTTGGVWETSLNIADIEQITPSQYWNDAFYEAATTASPGRGPRLGVSVGDWLTSERTSITCCVNIRYHVMLTKPLTFSQS